MKGRNKIALMKIFKNKKLFGELESEIMEILWEKNNVSVRDVLEILEKKRKIAYTTVMTVMSRLHDKGLLARELDQSGAYIYKPSLDKKTYLENTSKKAITSLIQKFGDVAVTQFIDLIGEGNIKNMKEWKKKLKKIK